MKALDAAVLGFVEGITEYLPISSTGHLILTERWPGIAESESAKTFVIAIQLGAIAAVIALYWSFFWKKIQEFIKREKVATQFFANLFIAFLPVAIVGLTFGSWIKRTLFSPMWVLAALVVGGVLMIVVEGILAKKIKSKKTKAVEELSYSDALTVGLCQIVSLWPGFSRSMATILGGRFVGLDPKAASEFSFFLAVPTLGAATAYEMLKALRSGGDHFNSDWWVALGIGLFVSFVTATIVIKIFLIFLRKYPLSIFGYYRIILASGLYFLLK